MDSPSSHDSGAFSVPAAGLASTPTPVPAPTAVPAAAQRIEAAPTPPPNDARRIETVAMPPPNVAVAPASPSAAFPDEDLRLAPSAAARVAPPVVPLPAEFAAPPPRSPLAAPPSALPPASGHPATVRLPSIAPPPAEPRPAVPTGIAASEAPVSGFLLIYANWRRAVSVSARKLEFPHQCACCMRPADAAYEARYVRTSGVRVVRSQGYAWAFPYCKSCLRHLNKAEWIKTASIAAGGSVGVLVLLALLAQGWIVAGLIAGVLLGVASWYSSRRWLFARLTRLAWADCACLGPAVRYDDFKGTIHRFSFSNRDYAAAFERANAKKLVDQRA